MRLIEDGASFTCTGVVAVAASVGGSGVRSSRDGRSAILGGCQTVVHGLATMRNRLSDAHGQGSKSVRPPVRHAELAVNIAGIMSMFLIATWEERKTKLTL